MWIKRFLLLLVAQLTFVGPVSAAETHVLFEDTFDEKLGNDWMWLREDKDAWRIKDGALEIRLQPGKAATVRNALLRKAPDRSKTNFAVEVLVTFTTDPTQQFEQGGITWYHQKKPVFKLVHEHIDGEEWIIPGRNAAPSKTVQLRLVVVKTQWKAQFRQDLGSEFQTAASGELPPPGEDHISLQCYDGPSNGEHWFRFDDFRIIELKD